MFLKYVCNGWVMLSVSLLCFLKFSGIEAVAHTAHYPTDLSIHVRQLNSLDFRQLKCVATAVYYESAHEPHLGQVAVARVIQNRVRQKFAESPCEVIYQRHQHVCQFSWACQQHRMITARECERCWQIACQVFAQQQYQNFMPTALFFHATYINPKWTNTRPIKTIGHHVFHQKR